MPLAVSVIPDIAYMIKLKKIVHIKLFRLKFKKKEISKLEKIPLHIFFTISHMQSAFAVSRIFLD